MSLCAVIVTYNRIEKLKRALESFDKQSFFPDKIIVVDNNSTDGTIEFLKSWNENQEKYRKETIFLPQNVGGSGGFYEGLRAASNENYDWIWVSDDDAYPDKDAVKEAVEYINSNDTRDISAICGTVMCDRGIDTAHRRIFSSSKLKITETLCAKDNYSKPFFEINAFSYVGSIINNNKLRLAGLTNKDLFIWYDDTEHSLRLSKIGKILVVPSIKVFHDCGSSAGCGLNWKDYYSIRNRMYLIKAHFPRYLTLKELARYECIAYKDYITGDKETYKVIKEATKDFRKNKLGIHPVYKPGWKPEAKKA